MTTIHFKCVPFQELSLEELYKILALRQEVFIVEQNCPFLDADGKDQHCWHLMGFDADENIVAYTRLVPTGVSYADFVSIGRVVTAASVRKLGAGKILMNESISRTLQLFGNQPIKIGAQSYLKHFYNNLGFRETGIEYLEDGIPHMEMIRNHEKF